MTGIVILLTLFGFLLAGIDIAFAMAGLGIVMLLVGGYSPLMIPQAMLASVDNFILLAVPLFILMANVLLKGGAGERLFSAVQSWIGHWPGGLAVATVLSCAIFGATSGSSVATSATIGTVAIPEMVSRGYERRFVFGLLAAGGTLGILIPPSIPMIVFGFVLSESIVDLFLAGIGPGLLLATVFIAYVVAKAHFGSGYQSMPRASWSERWTATARAFPAFALAAGIVFGIYLGVFTPTEAAGVGFVAALVITLGIYRSLRWSDLPEIAVSSMRTESMAPSYPGMPQPTRPPSKAGPAGDEAATMRPRPAMTTSVLVPTSTSRLTPSSPALRRSQATRSAAVSAPTWLAIRGRPYTRVWMLARMPRRRDFSTQAVVVRSPSRKARSTVDL